MHKLALVQAGRVTLEGAAGRWFILPGHLLFLPARRPYVFRAATGTRLTLVHLDPERTPWHHMGCWVTRSTGLANEMLAYATSWSPEATRNGDEARAFFRTIAYLCRDWFSNPRILWLPTARSGWMHRAIEAASQDLRGVTASQVAVTAGISVSTLQRHCKDELGMSWRELLSELRMTRAMELLVSTDVPIAKVAAAVGFRSIGAFSSAFGHRVGMRPRQFARAYGTACASNTRSQVHGPMPPLMRSSIIT